MINLPQLSENAFLLYSFKITYHGHGLLMTNLLMTKIYSQYLEEFH